MRYLLLCAAVFWAAWASAEDLFPQPPEIAADVAFWRRVYTEVDTASGFVHDERDLNVIYETLRFRSDTSEATRSREVEARKSYYQAILKSLAAGKRSGLTTDEARVLALFPGGVSNATLSQAVYDIRFQLGQSDRFLAGLKRSGRWEGYIRRAFAVRGMPEELAVLPHVESSFNPEAYSKYGAAGMWQFMPSTGQQFMRIDHVLDERLDPYASTDAAVELLALNNAVTGTWPLALTAYNHGAAGMRRAAQSLGTHDIVTILRHYRSSTFGFASRNFYLSFLAALEVDRNAETYFPGVVREEEQPLRTVRLPDYIPVAALSEALGIDADTLRAHNYMLMAPVWRGEKYVPAGYALRLPPGTLDAPQAERAIAGISSTLRFAAQVPDEFHIVARGDTLSGIADRYGVSMSDLVARNQLRSAHFIRAGQRINLPVSGVRAALAVPEPQAIPADGMYSVRRGDTLTAIAARHGLTVRTLAEINDLRDADRLQPGQLLALKTAQSDHMAMEAVAVMEESPTDEELAEIEEAEPVSTAAVKEAGVVAATAARPVTTADPADYDVAPDGTIEVQAIETLGHYADWLEIPTQRLRDMNGLSFGQAVAIGRRLRLNLSEVDAARFIERRVAYHRALQARFFEQFRIEGTREQQVRSGDNLWLLAQREPHLPVWLLRQYNPDLNFANLRPGVNVTIPQLVPQARLGEQG